MSNFVRNGVPITLDQTLDPDGPEYFTCYKLAADGSRRLEFIEYNAEEPEISRYDASISAGRPVREEVVGLYPLATSLVPPPTELRPRSGTIIRTLYLGYDFTDPFSDYPVNQVPYVTRWREHLATVADDFVSDTLIDVFALIHRDDGVAPVDVAHSVAERQAFEFVSYIVRTLTGVVWSRIDAVATRDAAASDAWKAEVVTLQGLVDRLCDSCAGRGWKRELVTHLKTWSWGAVYGIDPTAVHFPERDGAYWIPGLEMPGLTQLERDTWLARWNDALDHHHATTGDEAARYLTEPLPVVPAD